MGGLLQGMDVCFFFFQAEDGIRDLVRSRGLGDVYKRQNISCPERLSGSQVIKSTFSKFDGSFILPETNL